MESSSTGAAASGGETGGSVVVPSGGKELFDEPEREFVVRDGIADLFTEAAFGIVGSMAARQTDATVTSRALSAAMVSVNAFRHSSHSTEDYAGN
jgi:hypothetical protein